MEVNLIMCAQYLTANRREDSKEHWAKTFYSLVIRWKVQTEVGGSRKGRQWACFSLRSGATIVVIG